MATGTRFPLFNAQFWDYSGTRVFPASAYLLYTYISGTTTNQATYTDDELTIANTNPIVLDAAGRCSMFADPDLSYTLVLKTPAGVTVKTWDDVVSGELPLTGSFLPTAGGTMTGFITLHANATANLHAVPLQQLNDAIATALQTVTELTDAATAAAAAATAAAAAVKPEFYSLDAEDGSAATRDVYLTVGTWACTLQTIISKNDGGGTYSIEASQEASVGTTELLTEINLDRAGGSGYGRNIWGVGTDTGTLSVATAGTFTMQIEAADLDGATGRGSRLTCSKVA